MCSPRTMSLNTFQQLKNYAHFNLFKKDVCNSLMLPTTSEQQQQQQSAIGRYPCHFTFVFTLWLFFPLRCFSVFFISFYFCIWFIMCSTFLNMFQIQPDTMCSRSFVFVMFVGCLGDFLSGTGRKVVVFVMETLSCIIVSRTECTKYTKLTQVCYYCSCRS